LIALNRTWVAFGPVSLPSQPVQLTFLLQPVAAASEDSSWSGSIKNFVNRLVGTAQEGVFTVVGTYRSLEGLGGRIRGQLVGSFDNGVYNGAFTYDTPECTAEREFTATLDPQFLRLTGGRTNRDCKGSPLQFSGITMLVSQAPLPTTTSPTSSTTSQPLQCAYALSANNDFIGQAGGDRSVGIITGPGCAWSVQSFVDWIKVQPTSGTGPTTVILTIAPNPGPPRTATVVIAGLPFILNQGVTTTTTTIGTTSTPPTPDLLPISIDGSFCRTSDATNTNLRVQVRNSGSQAAAGPFITRVIFDSGSAITSQDRLVPGLAPVTNQEILFAIPDACRLSPNCNIQIIADANNGIIEENEGNNNVGASCRFIP
jgi:hypothetical protein